MKQSKATLKQMALRGMALVISAAALSSCIPGLDKLDDATMAVYPMKSFDASSSVSGLEAFTAIVAPLFVTGKCTSCHTTQSPQFGSSDRNSAYASAKAALNLVNPAQSKIVTKAGDGHCSPTCAILGSATWTTAMEQWAEAENKVAETPGAVPTTPTAPGPIVSTDGLPVFLTTTLTLNSTRTNATETFSLAAQGADFTNVSLVLTVDDPAPKISNAAQFSKLRIVNNSAKAIFLEGIRIFQSADSLVDPSNSADYKIDTGKAYSQISITVAPNTTATLATAESVVDKGDGLYIAFGFQKLEVSTQKTCKAQAYFNANVAPTMNSTTCLTCHNGNNASAKAAWTMSTNNTTLCNQALERADLNSPSNSSVVQRPFYNAAGHPNVSGLTDATLDKFLMWITSER